MSNKSTNGYFGGSSPVSGTSDYETSSKNCGCINNGVSCEVSSCVHYCDGQKCDADIIHVGNTSASSSYDTRCDTYKEKQF